MLCCLEFCPQTSDGGFVQIFGCVYLPTSGKTSNPIWRLAHLIVSFLMGSFNLNFFLVVQGEGESVTRRTCWSEGWITWCVDLIVGLGQKKSVPKDCDKFTIRIFVCSTPSPGRPINVCFWWLPFSRWNLCTNWGIKREGASNKDHIVTNVRTSSIPWEYWMTHEGQ